jgi:hypothetical protein
MKSKGANRMKRSKIACLAALAIALAVLTSTAQANPDRQIAVWLEMPEEKYVYCQYIWLYLFVANNGDETIAIPYASEEQRQIIDLSIVDQSGEKLPYFGPVDVPPHEDVRLAPADTIMFPLNVLNGYSVYEGRQGPPLYVPVGEYHATALYWGDYRTNEVRFTVRPPSVHEQEIIDEFAATSRQYRHGMDRVRDYIALFEKYRDTPFGSRIGDLVVGLMWCNETTDSLKQHYAGMMFDTYGADGTSQLALEWLLRTMSEDKAIAFLRPRREMFTNKYTRFMLKQAARSTGKDSVYREVMGQ